MTSSSAASAAESPTPADAAGTGNSAEHAVLDAAARARCIAIAVVEHHPLAVTVLAFEPLTYEPAVVALVLAGTARSHHVALRAGVVTVNLLTEAQVDLASRFGGAAPTSGWDEVIGIRLGYDEDCQPYLLDAAATMVLRVFSATTENVLARVVSATTAGAGATRAPQH